MGCCARISGWGWSVSPGTKLVELSRLLEKSARTGSRREIRDCCGLGCVLASPEQDFITGYSGKLCYAVFAARNCLLLCLRFLFSAVLRAAGFS